MSGKEWTLLLIGDERGLVGGPNCQFSPHPAGYKRVAVVEKAERDALEQRVRELEEQRDAALNQRHILWDAAWAATRS